MGKVRVTKLGDEAEKELKRRAEARRQTKKSKKPFGKTQGKSKVEGVGLKGGERVAVVEGEELKPEFKKLVTEVEEGKAPEVTQTKKPRKTKERQRSSRYKKARSLIDSTRNYTLSEAVALAKQTNLARFDASVEIHINLAPNAISDKKDLRGTVVLPHGTGKEVRVAIADDKVLSEIESGKINFDILVAHPSMMPKLAKFAKLLGPRGLMPNPKTGTVTTDPEGFSQSVAKGQVNFKTEPDHPILHLTVGKVSFDHDKLVENLEAILAAVGQGKIARATLTTTMGPGIRIQV